MCWRLNITADSACSGACAHAGHRVYTYVLLGVHVCACTECRLCVHTCTAWVCTCSLVSVDKAQGQGKGLNPGSAPLPCTLGGRSTA